MLSLLIGLSTLGWAEETVESTTGPELSIPFEKYELDNGLDVILSEDHSVPFVQVNLWYDVGSKDEVEGKTGFAHLFEHLMFQGQQTMTQNILRLYNRLVHR